MSDLTPVRLKIADADNVNVKFEAFAVDTGNPELQPDALIAFFARLKAKQPEGIVLEVTIAPLDPKGKACTEKNIPLFDSSAKIEEVVTRAVQSFTNLEAP